MLIKQKKIRTLLNKPDGAVTFFSIVMAIVLIITILILFFILKEVLKEEKVVLTIRVQNTSGAPITNAEILIDEQIEAATDSIGIYRYSYSASNQGNIISIRIRKPDYLDIEEKRTLGINPMVFPVTMLRPFASITINAVDSISNKPLKGVEVFVNTDKFGDTDKDGNLIIPPEKFRLSDNLFVQLQSKKYTRNSKDVLVASLDFNETFKMTKKRKAKAPRPKKKKPLPAVATLFETSQKEFEPVEPSISEPDEPVGINTVMVDSGWNSFKNNKWRDALDIYLTLTKERRWAARPDFWLYSADCALHLAGDDYGRYNSSMLDSALAFINKAERYQNRVKGSLFPALVQIKQGETYAYLHETQKTKSFKRSEEYRKKAVKLLTEGLNQLQNKKLTNTDLYKFALNLRNDVGDF